MALDKSIKPELEEKLVEFLDKGSLKRYLKYCNDLDLGDEVNVDQGFNDVCFDFIIRAEKNGYLIVFLQYLEVQHPNQQFKLWLGTVLRAAPPPPPPLPMDAPVVPGAPPSRPHQVHGHWLVDRRMFWGQLIGQVAQGKIRSMVVNGGTGKSHSRLLVGHVSENMQNSHYVCIPMDASIEAKLDSSALASMIATYVWGPEAQKEVDFYASDERKATSLPGLILNRMSGMNGTLWLVLDDLNKVRLEENGRTFIKTLFDAVNSPQCKNVRLFLLGIDTKQFPAGLGSQMQLDLVIRPTLQDIEDLVVCMAATHKAPLTADQLTAITSALDRLLPAAPSPEDWKHFHDQVNALEKSFH